MAFYKTYSTRMLLNRKSKRLFVDAVFSVITPCWLVHLHGERHFSPRDMRSMFLRKTGHLHDHTASHPGRPISTTSPLFKSHISLDVSFRGHFLYLYFIRNTALFYLRMGARYIGWLKSNAAHSWHRSICQKTNYTELENKNVTSSVGNDHWVQRCTH
jgi:hypothetical protein